MLASITLIALAAYLLIGEPLLGRIAHRRLLAALDTGDSGARLRFYRQWTWQGWALALITLVLTLGVAGWTPAQLGLCLPHNLPGSNEAHFGFLVGFIPTAIAGMVITVVVLRRNKAAAARMAGGANVTRMLPRTSRERWGFAALAVTAGLTEELIWRGFGLGALHSVLPHAHSVLLVALAALAFGWAHLYQGYTGMLAAGVLGALLAVLYIDTGSLLWPMLVHVLLDLKALLIPVGADTHPTTASPTARNPSP
ncbi:MAG: CPBP family intramembrane glutamic endopeptidase [Rhodanobacter sp.]